VALVLMRAGFGIRRFKPYDQVRGRDRVIEVYGVQPPPAGVLTVEQITRYR